VGRTGSFILWEQRDRSPEDRQTYLEGTEAAARVRCEEPEAQIFVAHPGVAGVFPRTPVLGSKDAWSEGPVLQTGEETSQTLDLPAGRWLLSIQYFSPVDATLSAPGFEVPLKAALDGQRPNTISLSNDGQYWPAGEFAQRSPGPARFTFATEEPSTLQELTGYDGKAYVGRIVAVPAGRHEVVPLGEACGRWLDWYRGTGAP
jgi:hypothetical protein